MLILLPPSAGKTSPTSGPRLSLDSLVAPEFTPLRSELITELEKVSAQENALSILKVGARVADDVAAQTELRSRPCAPAIDVYTGVLYAALKGEAEWDAQATARAAESVLIFSGLFGFTGPQDLIPNYRLSMGTTLPQAGNTATRWRETLREYSRGSGELVIDARSGAYRVWDPPHSADHVLIRAVRETETERKVISHDAKRYRGLLAGEILRSGAMLADAEELAEFAYTLVEQGIVSAIELDPPGKRRFLTLVDRQ